MFYVYDYYYSYIVSIFFSLDMNSVTFELIDGAILMSPSIATPGVISLKEGVGVITCCMECAGRGNCAGIFYDSTLSICKPYSFQNYTAMNIYGIQNFVKISPGTKKIINIIFHQLCIDFTTCLWNIVYNSLKFYKLIRVPKYAYQESQSYLYKTCLAIYMYLLP